MGTCPFTPTGQCRDVAPCTVFSIGEDGAESALSVPILGRQETSTHQERVIICESTAGRLVLDSNTGEVISSPYLPAGHEPINLPFSEAQILRTLVKRQGRVVDREALYDSYRPGEGLFGSIRAVDVGIRRVREGIGQPKHSENTGLISTVRSMGYIIRRPRVNGKS